MLAATPSPDRDAASNAGALARLPVNCEATYTNFRRFLVEEIKYEIDVGTPRQ